MAVKPRQDHYVAETYLRHFSAPGAMLRAYRKSNGVTFPCWPRDVCKEPAGDTIPEFLSEPSFLGEFRAEFEPLWNGAVKALAERKFRPYEKQIVAGYWANLLVFTPTWRRLGVGTYDKMTVDFLEAHQQLSEKKGMADPVMTNAMQMMREGKIKFSTDPEYIRAQSAVQLTKHMWRLYNATWHVLVSDVDADFVTSDNPASFEDQGDWPQPKREFVRYLPITPRLCLSCDLTRDRGGWEGEPDFERPPRGQIKGGSVKAATVRHVNVCTAKCAEDLVFTGTENEGVRRMVAKYARFRVEGEFQKIPNPTGYYIASRSRAIERKVEPNK